MKLDKMSSKTKIKIAQNARTKETEPCAKLKKVTRAADGGLISVRKCEDRKKVCRQIVTSKQKCLQIKEGKTKKVDGKKIIKTEKTKNQDVKKSIKAGKTKDISDKRTAYFSVELPDKDLRSLLRNFSDKLILNMPGIKQERTREIQCKIVGYETKKRKILKVVSQPGEKREEISHTANALLKMKEKITEKSEENKSKENTEDSIGLSFPMNTRAYLSAKPLFDQSAYHLFSLETSKPSPTMNQDLLLQPSTLNPFLGDAQIKDPTDAPAYQPTSSSQQFPSQIFLNDNLLLENCNRTLAKNQWPAVPQVLSTQQLAPTAFSSSMAASNTSPAVEYTPSSKEFTIRPFSNKMHLNGFKEDTLDNLATVFEQVSTIQPSAHALFSRNATPNGCGEIRTHNESPASECALSLQKFTTVLFPNGVPLNAYNATEKGSEIINISKKSFNQMCSNQTSSIKRAEDQSIVRDYIAGKGNLPLLGSHVTAMDDSKHLKSALSSDLSNLRSKILENIGKKKINAVKANKQNVQPFMDFSSNKCAGEINQGNLKAKINSSANRIQHDNCNPENSECNKNKFNFKFSIPIYNYVDFIASDSETAASPDTSNISEVPMDNFIVSNSSPSLNYNVLQAHLACCELSESFAPPNMAKDSINTKNLSHTPTYGSDTSENRSQGFIEDRSPSNTNYSNTTVTSSSESVSSQRSSCDSCLVTSSSTDDEYEGNMLQHSSSFACDTLRPAAGNSDICEEYSTNAASEDLEQTETNFSLEPILSPISLMSFNDEELRDSDSKHSFKRMRPHRKTVIKPFENGSLYWLKQGRYMRKNHFEARETIPTRNSRNRNSNYDSLRMKYLMTSRFHEKGRSGNRSGSFSGDISKSKNNHFQEQSSIQQNDKKNSKKINVTPKIEAAQSNNKMLLEQLSTDQILAQIGFNVLTYRISSPKNTCFENLMTMFGYKT